MGGVSVGERGWTPERRRSLVVSWSKSVRRCGARGLGAGFGSSYIMFSLFSPFWARSCGISAAMIRVAHRAIQRGWKRRIVVGCMIICFIT